MTVLEWYKTGWKVFADQPVRLVAGFLIFALLTGSLEVLNEALRIEGALVHIVQFVIAPAAIVGWSVFCLRAARGERPAPVRVFDGFAVFANAFIAAIVAGIIIVIGLALLVVPGVIAAAVLCMWPFGVGVRRLSAIDALRYSRNVTRGRRVDLVLAFLVYVLLSIVGALLFGVGLIIVGPWTGATFAVIYDDLTGDRAEHREGVDYEIVE